MEAASENPEKRGRGRPPKYSTELYLATAQHLGGFGQGRRTDRARQDRVHAARAMIRIGERYADDYPGRLWLFDPERRKAKITLLAELGRLAEQEGAEKTQGEAFWTVVDALVLYRPPIKTAIRDIRLWRTARPRQESERESVLKMTRAWSTTDKPPPEPDPDATARAIMELLESYPEDTAYQILDRLLVTYRQEEGRD